MLRSLREPQSLGKRTALRKSTYPRGCARTCRSGLNGRVASTLDEIVVAPRPVHWGKMIRLFKIFIRIALPLYSFGEIIDHQSIDRRGAGRGITHFHVSQME